MTDNKNLEKQVNALTDEELDVASGGLVNMEGVVKNPNAGMLDAPSTSSSGSSASPTLPWHKSGIEGQYK